MSPVHQLASQPSYYSTLEIDTYAPDWYFEQSVKPDFYSKKIVFSKTENKYDLFFPKIAQLLNGLNRRFDVVIPIPRSKIGLFSPTIEKIAEGITNSFGIANRKMIHRIVEGPKNTELHTTGERYQSTHGAFECEELAFGERNILLLDDVKTTGFTILECGSLLKTKGASEITAVCLGINRGNWND